MIYYITIWYHVHVVDHDRNHDHVKGQLYIYRNQQEVEKSIWLSSHLMHHQLGDNVLYILGNLVHLITQNIKIQIESNDMLLGINVEMKNGQNVGLQLPDFGADGFYGINQRYQHRQMTFKKNLESE